MTSLHLIDFCDIRECDIHTFSSTVLAKSSPLMEALGRYYHRDLGDVFLGKPSPCSHLKAGVLIGAVPDALVPRLRLRAVEDDGITLVDAARQVHVVSRLAQAVLDVALQRAAHDLQFHHLPLHGTAVVVGFAENTSKNEIVSFRQSLRHRLG